MGIKTLRNRAAQPTHFFAVTMFLILPASANQTTSDCDKAIANYQAITEFDKQAVKERLQICGTPALIAREQMRVACMVVETIGNNPKPNTELFLRHNPQGVSR